MSVYSKTCPDITFIYALRDPVTGHVRYVGKSNDPIFRLKQHIKHEKRNPHRFGWLRQLQGGGLTMGQCIVCRQAVETDDYFLSATGSVTHGGECCRQFRQMR